MFKSIFKMMIPTLSFVNSMYEITFIYSPQTLEHDISLNKNDSNHDFTINKNNDETNLQTVNFNIGGTKTLTLN